MLEPLRAAAERGARRRPGRNGKSRARPTPAWPDRGEEAARRLVGGAHRPPEGDRRLDRRARPMSSISTTGPTRTSRASASPGRSRSRACRRTASSPSRDDSWSTRSTPPRATLPARTAERAGGRISPRWCSTTCTPPASSSRTRSDRITLRRRSSPGRATSSPPRAAIIEGETAASAAPAIFIGPEFGTVDPQPTSSPPRARPSTRASTC